MIWNLKLKYIKPRTKSVQYVFSYLSLYNYLLAGCRLPQTGVIEIIAHPGNTYLEYFKNENILIEKKGLLKLLPNFQLITYNDL